MGDEPDDARIGWLSELTSIENRRYRQRHIYTGENWNPELRAPLSAPGIQVSQGDYLLEVNGRPLLPPTNVYSLFEGTAGHQVQIRVNKTPSLEGSRIISVDPIASEDALRSRAWIEEDHGRLLSAKLAYVWLRTGRARCTFTRYYYARDLGRDH
jgi:tricorn protease